MPCLNERLTLGTCIRKALATIHRLAIRAEVIVADNGSSDGSQAIAESLGARVVAVEARGFGIALRIVMPGFVSLTLGIQVVLSSFFISQLGMARR
jgi:glycosyltransferase involved in cell wall biosynthesis